MRRFHRTKAGAQCFEGLLPSPSADSFLPRHDHAGCCWVLYRLAGSAREPRIRRVRERVSSVTLLAKFSRHVHASTRANHNESAANMDDRNIQRRFLGPLTLQRLGEMLRGKYLLPATLPSGMYDLVTRLERCELGASGGAYHREQALVYASKESAYLQHAAEAMRLAQHAASASAKARLVKLATAWIDLAKRTHDRRD
jgi:hypothetical protein